MEKVIKITVEPLYGPPEGKLRKRLVIDNMPTDINGLEAIVGVVMASGHGTYTIVDEDWDKPGIDVEKMRKKREPWGNYHTGDANPPGFREELASLIKKYRIGEENGLDRWDLSDHLHKCLAQVLRRGFVI